MHLFTLFKKPKKQKKPFINIVVVVGTVNMLKRIKKHLPIQNIGVFKN